MCRLGAFSPPPHSQKVRGKQEIITILASSLPKNLELKLTIKTHFHVNF